MTGQLLGNLELDLTDETATARGYLLSLPEDPESDTVAPLKDRIGGLRGKLAAIEAPASWSDTPQTTPRTDVQTARVGPDFPEVLASLRTAVGKTVLAACGVPVELVEAGDGTGQREAWRRFLFGSVAPVARLIEHELSRKLETVVKLGFQELRASDLAGRARVFQSMVGGGMDVARAAALSGLVMEG